MRPLVKSLALRSALLAGAAAALPAQAAPFAHDGSYRGSMTELPATSQANSPAGHPAPACTYRRPVSMRIEHGQATITFSDWAGHTTRYRGPIARTGAVVAWHVNGDGSRSMLTGRFEDAGFTGYLDRDHELCPYKLTLPAASPRIPAR